MFKVNGRVKKEVSNKKDSKHYKEFICSVCGKKKSLANIEFGELIVCDCGKYMIENNQE
jgi:ssDNA-binding Zn-finger/Zn-ribbon topoisomerase 1